MRRDGSANRSGDETTRRTVARKLRLTPESAAMIDRVLGGRFLSATVVELFEREAERIGKKIDR